LCDTGRVTEIWRLAGRRSKEFDESAVAYDRYRPRYPDEIIDDIIHLGGLQSDARTIEIGAGTGIGTAALVEHGLRVVAIEPSAGMREVAQEKLGDRAQFVDGRFEDWSATDPVDAIVSFSAWHWVDPGKGVDLAANVLPRGGTLAVAWTEVVSWGQGDFEGRLAEVTGSPWPKRVEHMRASLEPVRDDARFGEFVVRRHTFERDLDAATFIGLTRTYPGFHSPKRDIRFRQIIDNDFSGSVKRIEDAVLYVCRRN
jgi:SAM-dependent methyltransferase